MKLELSKYDVVSLLCYKIEFAVFKIKELAEKVVWSRFRRENYQG